jgi:hypothetical protein
MQKIMQSTKTSQSMAIFSVLHQIQGPGFQGYVEDPAYAFWVKRFLSQGVDFIFEEASGRGPSVAEDLTKARTPEVKYLDVDPSAAERPKYGISNSSTGGPIDPVHSYDVYETVVFADQMKREEEWIRRIKTSTFTKGLFICGVAHGLSFGAKLESGGITVQELYNYIPHSLVCPQGPHRF